MSVASCDRTPGRLGLGLAIALGLVELHGGWTSAASDGENNGSTFSVALPVFSVGAAGIEPATSSV